MVALDPGFRTATKVTCFHETDGAPQNWPVDVEIVRRTIKENLEAEINIEIFRGEDMYWSWDRWVFCAGHGAKFSEAGDWWILRNAMEKDGSPPTPARIMIPVRISGVAGKEAHNCMLRMMSAVGILEPTLEAPPPPVELEEMEGGVDGIFMTKSLLFNQSDGTFGISKEAAIKDSAQIFISMRARSDRPIKTLFTNSSGTTVSGHNMFPRRSLRPTQIRGRRLS